MDILFYSNYCKHSKQLIHFLVKNRLSETFSAICIDNRFKEEKTNATIIMLDNGSTYRLPINVQSVPTLLLITQKFRTLVGEQIYDFIKPMVKEDIAIATKGNGEPMFSYSNSSLNSVSYANENNMTSSLFVSANHEDVHSISTPELNAKVAKIGEISLEELQKMREKDIRPLSHDQLDFGAMPGNSFMASPSP